MKRTTAAVAAMATLIGTLGLASGSSAEAAAVLSVTSPRCGTVVVTNKTSEPRGFLLDTGQNDTVWVGQTRTFTGLPGGVRNWIAHANSPQAVSTKGVLRVAGCPGGPVVAADGDENGDGRADVMAVTTAGDLYYYPTTGKGLGPGRKVGHGWQGMSFVQRTGHLRHQQMLNPIPSGRSLLAVDSTQDRNIWHYPLGPGTRVGKGVRGPVTNMRERTPYSILPNNEPRTMYSPTLLFGQPTQDDVLLMREGFVWSQTPPGFANGWKQNRLTIGVRDFDGDHWADIITIRHDGTMWVQGVKMLPQSMTTVTKPRQIGHGWGSMQLVSSPGSLDGDELNDLVARRSDGHLYRYTNKGGHWGPAEKIGSNWQEIRLLP